MEDLLRSKGIYRVTLGTKSAPDEDEQKAKWENKNDQARGLIGMSISLDLRFHLDGEDSPVKAQENELLTLDPSKFPSIEYCLSKFKTLKLLLEGCNVSKEEDPLIYGILAKLPPAYSVLYPPSILLEKLLLTHELCTKLPPLIPFVIL